MTSRREKLRSSQNACAGIDSSDAEDDSPKAVVVAILGGIIKARKLTRTAASHLLHIEPPKLSKILRGQHEDISIASLMFFLAALDHDVEIVVTPKPKGKKPATVTVRAA